METKHVPGPWSVFDDGGETYGIIRYADGTPTSTQDGCSMNGEVFICDLAIKNEANAALIAAAPTMASRIQGALDCLSQNRVFPGDIARAKGERF